MPEAVGLSARGPSLERLSDLLSIKRSATALGVEQRQAAQAAALAKYDWNKHVGADGVVDVASMNDPELMAAAGDQFQDVLQQATSTREAQLQAQRTLVSLRGEQRAEFGAMMNALRSDPDVVNDTPAGRQKVNQAMVQYGEIHGEDVLPVLRAYAKPLQEVPQGSLNDALRSVGLQATSAEQQFALQQPTLTDTGGRLLDVNPLSPTRGGQVERTVGPQVLTDAAGNQFTLDPNTNTVSPVGAGGRGPQGQPAAPSAAPGDAPFARNAPYVGSAADAETFGKEVAGVRAAADQAPVQRATLRHILDLTKETNTGPLASYLQETKIGGQLFGDNYQELGKYLERNALQAMTAMGGPPSDARLSAAVAANGSTKFNPEALRAVTVFNHAANTGLERFREGLDKFLGTNPDYTRLPEFKAAWAKNFDVDAFMLENAIEDGDEATQKKILEGMTPERRRDLARKMENLDALATTGRLP